jgi:glycosyltransferase 2 family protein
MPVLLTLHLGMVVMVATVLGMAGIVVILTVCPVFRVVHRMVARIPLLKRLLPAIDELQLETADLLHRSDSIWLSTLDLVRALASVTVLWLIVQGLSPRSITWTDAGFVLAISSIGGAISMIPGGVGANEASVVGLLLVFGVDGGAAAAAALVQRLLITGMAIALGMSAYEIARRRFKLGRSLSSSRTSLPPRRPADRGIASRGSDSTLWSRQSSGSASMRGGPVIWSRG